MENWFIDLIKRYEGFKPNAYWDKTHYSIGYGSDTMPNGKPVQVNDVITEQEAVKLIPNYIKKKENLIKEYFPEYDTYPQQVKYALIDQIYRGGPGSLGKSPKYVAAVKEALSDGKITVEDMPNIIKELEIDSDKAVGVQNRKRRRAALLLGIYDPKHNKSVGEGQKDFYYTFDKDYNNPNTMWGQVIRTMSLPQNFTQRLWDPNRQSIDLGNGQFGTHKLSYKTSDKGDIIYPEIQQKFIPEKGFWFWKKPAHYSDELIDLSGDREKAWETAKSLGDTIVVPSGMGEQFTTQYKQYIPGFKNGNQINYLKFFK